MKKIIVIGIILFIGFSIIPEISGLNTEPNNSDFHNSEYTEFIDNEQLVEVVSITSEGASSKIYSEDGPLGEWPDFTPIGFITAPHPDYPQYQTHLYGDWGGIVGEEFVFLQGSLPILLRDSTFCVGLPNTCSQLIFGPLAQVFLF